MLDGFDGLVVTHFSKIGASALRSLLMFWFLSQEVVEKTSEVLGGESRKAKSQAVASGGITRSAQNEGRRLRNRLRSRRLALAPKGESPQFLKNLQFTLTAETYTSTLEEWRQNAMANKRRIR